VRSPSALAPSDSGQDARGALAERELRGPGRRRRLRRSCRGY